MQLMEMVDLYFRLALSMLGLSVASAIAAGPTISLLGLLVASLLYGASFATWAKALGLTKP
jgi:hypothetical protein